MEKLHFPIFTDLSHSQRSPTVQGRGQTGGKPIQFHSICKLQFKVNVGHFVYLQLFSGNQSKFYFIIISAFTINIKFVYSKDEEETVVD